ncbi:hypothetical protein GYH30_018472 [Glycine max]|nr:hypothetical protein GYH30_018472 [Glycine max]
MTRSSSCSTTTMQQLPGSNFPPTCTLKPRSPLLINASAFTFCKLTKFKVFGTNVRVCFFAERIGNDHQGA